MRFCDKKAILLGQNQLFIIAINNGISRAYMLLKDAYAFTSTTFKSQT